MSKLCWIRTVALVALAGVAFEAGAMGQAASGPDAASLLMPVPASVKPGQGEFVIDETMGVNLEGFKDQRLIKARLRFLETLGRVTGMPMMQATEAGVLEVKAAQFHVETTGRDKEVVELGEDESYKLEVTPDAVHLTAPNPLGVMHGLQTFVQLVRPTAKGFAVAAVTIEDKPRFPWRGLMIDSGRHFIPLPVILRNLDAMEAVKLNVFHWHLSDDQGFRVESKAFPYLQLKGSDGLYYTQAQIREVIEYARDRGIRVVPEFDMPAHATAWFVGYPELGSGKGPYSIERTWGVLDPAMVPTKECTYQFLNLLIGEMSGLFPDAYFHVGGDECDGKEWDANPRIQEFKKAYKLADNSALQAYFSGRVQKLVTGHHKIMEGWDEVLQPDTPKDVVIQSWRGRASLLDAAQRGYRGLLSTGYYIDLNQPAAEHYLVDPLEGIADKLTPEQTASILGGEATIWSEFVNGEIIDSRIWPRTATIAERLWSAQSVRDVDSMYRRLPRMEMLLTSYGIDPRATSEMMLERMSAMRDPKALRVLASVVEPPKGYARGGMRNYTSQTPLNHLVDAVAPESEQAREFHALCVKIAAGNATSAELDMVRNWLMLWRDNDAQLQPMLSGSDITAELGPVSTSLRQTAEVGLRALDGLRDGKAVSADARKSDLAVVAEAAKPKAELLLMVAPAVEILMKAVKTN